MRVKSLILFIALTTPAMGDEPPPELPFQAVDGTLLVPGQETVMDNLGISQPNKPTDGHFELGGKIVDGTLEAPAATITPNPLEADQATAKNTPLS